MEFASLEDAYGVSPKKNKSIPRNSKEGFQAYELPPTDPDRPAVKRMLEIPPINQSQSGDPMNEYLDQSTQFQMRPTVNNSLPKPRLTTTTAPSMPSFFGVEPFTNPNEESMAPFTGRSSNANGYMLESDFTKSFDQPGYGRSSGVPLPTPELRQRWKPLSVDRVDTAFTTSGKSSQFTGLDTGDFAAMKSKLDTLMARLDDLEYRAGGTNPQMEMLSFIMTGLFLMFVLDVTARKTGRG